MNKLLNAGVFENEAVAAMRENALVDESAGVETNTLTDAIGQDDSGNIFELALRKASKAAAAINSEEIKMVDEIHELNAAVDANEKENIELMVELGQKLIDLKAKIKIAKKGRWKKYLRVNFPKLHKKRAQRAMRLAAEINLTIHPALKFLSQRKLLALVSLKGDTPLRELLQTAGIDASDAATENIALFKVEIDKLIDWLKSEKDVQGGAENLSKVFARQLERLTKEFVENFNDGKFNGSDEGRSELQEIERYAQELLTAVRSHLNGG